MFTTLLRISAAVGPSVIWVTKFFAAVTAVFVLYIGLVILATLHATNSEQRQVRYQIFRDLLDLFRCRRDR